MDGERKTDRLRFQVPLLYRKKRLLTDLFSYDESLSHDIYELCIYYEEYKL